MSSAICHLVSFWLFPSSFSSEHSNSFSLHNPSLIAVIYQNVSVTTTFPPKLLWLPIMLPSSFTGNSFPLAFVVLLFSVCIFFLNVRFGSICYIFLLHPPLCAGYWQNNKTREDIFFRPVGVSHSFFCWLYFWVALLCSTSPSHSHSLSLLLLHRHQSVYQPPTTTPRSTLHYSSSGLRALLRCIKWSLVNI